ncbi:PrsW family intramembrane metalloprotease [Actinomadura rugatobispora]|uniref:PrsW family intramembrane metalloprotease n=1 Tax=Actinomadura rugatobispora TaxID=1994 RepID=A0ABW0ZT66_9ACTN|nr:hypothetical protein GCM10010200_024680 [Actinomadura rugatobispora]
MTGAHGTIETPVRVPSAGVLAVGHRRLLGGLAIAAVPVLYLLSVTWYQAVVYDDELAYTYVTWSVPLLGVGAAGVVSLVALTLVRPVRWRRRGQVLVAAVLAVFLPAWFTVLHWGRGDETWATALICVPTTLFCVVMCRRVERSRRLPWALVAVAFVWGMCVAIECARMTTMVVSDALTGLVTPGRPFVFVQALATGLNEEAVKAAGVLAVLFVFRHRVNGALGGLAIGSVVGAGFQFTESAAYMLADETDVTIYQYWVRQYVALLSSHTVYTGIAGAALGLAFQQRGVWRTAVCALSGYVAAVVAHAIWNIAGSTGLFWQPEGATTLVYVAMPLNSLIYHGPYFVLLAVLGIAALRFEVRGLMAELRNEARTGLGAILPDEVDVLARASARFRTRWRLYRRRDYARYRHVRRLHAAQIDLAFARWHRARGDFGVDRDLEDRLRHRVHRIRRNEPLARLDPGQDAWRPEPSSGPEPEAEATPSGSAVGEGHLS